MAKKRGELVFPELSYKIIGCVFEVYKELGSNHKERVYQQALAKEFSLKDIHYQEQYPVDVEYKGDKIGKYCFDFLIEDKIVLELKSSLYFKKEHFEQVLDYLKTSNKKLGIIVNFTSSGAKFYRLLNL